MNTVRMENFEKQYTSSFSNNTVDKDDETTSSECHANSEQKYLDYKEFKKKVTGAKKISTLSRSWLEFNMERYKDKCDTCDYPLFKENLIDDWTLKVVREKETVNLTSPSTKKTSVCPLKVYFEQLDVKCLHFLGLGYVIGHLYRILCPMGFLLSFF